MKDLASNLEAMMLPRSTFHFALIMVLALLMSGCGKKASNEIDFGTIEKSRYKNQYFGFTIGIPEDWSVQDQEAQRRLMKKGVKLVAGEDENFKTVVKAAVLQTVNLFAVFQHPLGSPVEYNPSMMSLAESVRDYPGIKRGKDYLFQARKMLEAGQVQVSFPRKPYSEHLGNVEFDVMELEMTMIGKTVKQKYYAAIQKGYALCFIVSFTNQEEEAALKNILATVSFTPTP